MIENEHDNNKHKCPACLRCESSIKNVKRYITPDHWPYIYVWRRHQGKTCLERESTVEVRYRVWKELIGDNTRQKKMIHDLEEALRTARRDGANGLRRKNGRNGH